MESLMFHPKVVHLPIALSILMPFISTALVLAWWRGWLPRRTWWLAVALQIVLTGSALAARSSGEAEEERVERHVPESAIEAHEEAADLFLIVAGGGLVLFVLGGAIPHDRAARALATAAAVSSVVTLGLGYRVGEAGGHLVYEHGAASAYVDAPSQPSSSPNAGEESEHDEHEHDDD